MKMLAFKTCNHPAERPATMHASGPRPASHTVTPPQLLLRVFHPPYSHEERTLLFFSKNIGYYQVTVNTFALSDNVLRVGVISLAIYNSRSCQPFF